MDDEQALTEEPNMGDSVEELLEYLKVLDDVPNEIGNVSNGDDNEYEFKQEEFIPNEFNTNSAFMDTGLPIPNITISMPEGSELDGEQAIPQINISFSNLPPVSVPAISEPSKADLKREQINLLKHNFVHKLYLATNSPQMTFLNWSEDGQLLQLDYIGLQEHLTGNHSLFRSRNVKQFIRHILDIGFERVEQLDLLEDRIQLFYEHMYFKPGEPDLLLMLSTPKLELFEYPTPRTDASESLNPCSPLQLARHRLQALLRYHSDIRQLQRQEPIVDKIQPRRGRITSSKQPTLVLPPSLASRHVNPKDSVEQLKTESVPEYAGFYGKAEPALISEFFAEYLPRYGARLNGSKDILVDATKSNSFQQNLPIGVVFSDDEEEPDGKSDQEIPEVPKIEDVQPDALLEDTELEKVMQELCGVVSDVEEEEIKLEKSTPKPKLKRKRTTRKRPSTDNESSPEDAGKDLLKILQKSIGEEDTNEENISSKDSNKASISSKDSNKANISSKNIIKENISSKDIKKENISCSIDDDPDKDAKAETGDKTEVKRRRYDLRPSKAKRSY